MKTKYLLPLLFALSLTSCGSSKTISLSKVKTVNEIHQLHQAEYLNDPSEGSIIGKYAAYAPNEDYANPLPIVLKWKSGSKVRNYMLTVSENEDLSNPWLFDTVNSSYSLYNCKVNTTYYYQVEGILNDSESTVISSEIGSFKTNETILRNIFVEGVDNFRDLGGYKTVDNKTVKQGLIYRSAQLNTSKDTALNLLATENGLRTLNSQLKIKTEIDLRTADASSGSYENSGITSSPIGENVTYVNLPMLYGGENILEHSNATTREMNLNSVKSFFTLLADSSNYPLVFHCVQGKDRTGCLAYLLNALLGVSSGDLMRDYLFTNFSKSVGSPCKESDIENRYLVTLSKEEGSTLKDKAYNYLTKTLEIPSATIDSVINNLVY